MSLFSAFKLYPLFYCVSFVLNGEWRDDEYIIYIIPVLNFLLNLRLWQI